jgi:hypothetical protein
LFQSRVTLMDRTRSAMRLRLRMSSKKQLLLNSYTFFVFKIVAIYMLF